MIRNLRTALGNHASRRRAAIACAAALLFCLLAAGFAGCSGAEGSQGFVDPIPQAEVDLTPTDELVIYLPRIGFIQSEIEIAISSYQRLYPDVHVTVEVVGDDSDWGQQYVTRVNNELMASAGPDVIIASTYIFPDLYKMMDIGAFLDISSIMDSDQTFDISDYNRAVLDAGLYKGGRYVVPYSFAFPVLIAFDEAMGAAGYDISKNTDFISFMGGVAGSAQVLRENRNFKFAISRFPYFFSAIYDAAVTLVDYENKTVVPDEGSLKSFCEAYKPYWDVDFKEGPFVNGNYSGVEHLQNGSALLGYYSSTGLINVPGTMIEAKEKGIAYTLAAVPAMDGGIAATVNKTLAIRAGSPNQLNAWNFIKVMLSEGVQRGTDQGGAFTDYLVNLSAMQAAIGGHTGLTSDEKKAVLDLLGSVTVCLIPNNTIIYDFLYESMASYFNDEKSYDECIKELKSKLTLYLSE